MCACASVSLHSWFYPPPHPNPRATYFPPSSPFPPRCASVLKQGGGHLRQRGCAALPKLPSPRCVGPNRKRTRATHDVMWQWLQREQGCCACACALCAVRLHPPVARPLLCGCLDKSHAVCFIRDHGPLFPRELRNIQPHPLIVKGGLASVQ